jgi:hypothetical protein
MLKKILLTSLAILGGFSCISATFLVRSMFINNSDHEVKIGVGRPDSLEVGPGVYKSNGGSGNVTVVLPGEKGSSQEEFVVVVKDSNDKVLASLPFGNGHELPASITFQINQENGSPELVSK